MERGTAGIRRPRRAFQILVNENQIAHTIEKEGSVYRVLRKSGFLQAFCELKSHGVVNCRRIVGNTEITIQPGETSGSPVIQQLEPRNLAKNTDDQCAQQ